MNLRRPLSKQRCPNCGDPLEFLRWGHEERCARFQLSRRRGALRVGALLLVLAFALLALPAHAQTIDPKDLAAGLSSSLTSALAWGCVVLWLMLVGTNVFWVKVYLAQTNDRFAAQQAAHDATVATLTSVVKLSTKQTEAMDVLDKAIDRFTRE